MPDNVIQGEGKPRFQITTGTIWSGTSSASSSTSITLAGGVALDDLDGQYGLVNVIIFTLNSSSEGTIGIITAYNDTTDVLTVASWTNGTPLSGQAVILKDKQIDLPYCQRLTERWTPDFIVKKMLTGDIRRNKRGFYYSATLDYSQYFHKDEMEIIRDLFNKDYQVFTFYPRLDNAALSYSIDIDPESEVAFYQLKNHLGHGGISISIIGIERLDKIEFLDPTQAVTGAPASDEDIYPTDDEDIYPTED